MCSLLKHNLGDCILHLDGLIYHIYMEAITCLEMEGADWLIEPRTVMHKHTRKWSGKNRKQEQKTSVILSDNNRRLEQSSESPKYRTQTMTPGRALFVYFHCNEKGQKTDSVLRKKASQPAV